MRIGKLDNAALDRLILSKFESKREEVICSPQIGADCAAVNFGDKIAVFSTDPITAASNNIGRLTVCVSCNDAAAAGAEPIGLLVTVLAPESVTEIELDELASEIAIAAKEANVDIIGGHTEVTTAVNRIVTSATVIAKTINDRPIEASRDMRIGNSLVMTKHAGLEGMSIIAADHFERIADYVSQNEREELLSWSLHTSVVPEGKFAAINGATGMHDVTEGGILGAAWEMGYSAGLGIEIDLSKIPLRSITRRIASALNIDPYKLISSGCMLISCDDGEKMVEGLASIGIEAAVIGRVIESGAFLTDGRKISPPTADEIYKL